MTAYALFILFALAVCAVGFREMWREDRARNDLGAHFDQAVSLGNAEGER